MIDRHTPQFRAVEWWDEDDCDGTGFPLDPDPDAIINAKLWAWDSPFRMDWEQARRRALAQIDEVDE